MRRSSARGSSPESVCEEPTTLISSGRVFLLALFPVASRNAHRSDLDRDATKVGESEKGRLVCTHGDSSSYLYNYVYVDSNSKNPGNGTL